MRMLLLAIILHRPMTAMEALDDRSANGEPDAHTVTLRGVERFEERFSSLADLTRPERSLRRL
jgi:hypothetical protein